LTHKAPPLTTTHRAGAGIDALVLLCMGILLSASLAGGRLIAPAETKRPDMAATLSAGSLERFFPWRPKPEAKPEPVAPLPHRSAPAARALPYAGSLGLYTRLQDGARDPYFRPSEHDNHGSFYGGSWRAANVEATVQGTALRLRRTPDNSAPYSMAEIQSAGLHHYGRYEAILQPAADSGTVSAFFTYTGPYFGDPHDEIDIEFLGRDTTRIHFNYFRNGRTGRSATFDLPFDASDKARLYAFEWSPDGIIWFVEDSPYYATLPDDPRLPRAPGKIMLSFWTGVPHMQGWHGPPRFGESSRLLVSCVSFVPAGMRGRQCSDSRTAALQIDQ
jgi:endo-1,3-1,4-beta-glycanase ExoK